MKKYSVIWRIEGDMTVTEVKTDMDTSKMSSHDWLTLAVLFDAEEKGSPDPSVKLNNVFMSLFTALDPNNPDYIGYEMVGVIAHPEDMENLPWVAI